MNFIVAWLHCNSTFISYIVKYAFTKMNSPIGKNVRRNALE